LRFIEPKVETKRGVGRGWDFPPAPAWKSSPVQNCPDFLGEITCFLNPVKSMVSITIISL